jgi:membrane-bound lytic murein transglycosylase B
MIDRGPRQLILPITVLACVGLLAAALSAPRAPATTPQDLATQLTANDTALRQAIDVWRMPADPPTTLPPAEVTGPAGFLQNTVRKLAAHSNLATATIPLLSGAFRSELDELTDAGRDLLKLSRHSKHRKLRVGPPRPLSELRSHYDEAAQRYGIGWSYLAAIHYVETKFGQVKNDSVAGAKGPMQFLPSTWKIYGNGGDIRDPHDAILAAANLLHDRGAPGDYRRALRAYNQAGLLVSAVTDDAQVLDRDPYALYFLYCWQP